MRPARSDASGVVELSGQRLLTSLPRVIAKTFGRVATARATALDVRRQAVADGAVALEQAAPVPGEHPRRQEVEARQVTLDQVDRDARARTRRRVDQVEQVVDRALRG